MTTAETPQTVALYRAHFLTEARGHETMAREWMERARAHYTKHGACDLVTFEAGQGRKDWRTAQAWRRKAVALDA